MMADTAIAAAYEQHTHFGDFRHDHRVVAGPARESPRVGAPCGTPNAVGQHLQAILEAPDPSTWSGQRDRVMLATLYNTGARISELIGMRVADLSFESGPAIHIRGKGRKERQVPLWPQTARQLKRWLRQYPREPHQPLFINRSGDALTRIGVSERLKLAARSATRQFPQLA